MKSSILTLFGNSKTSSYVIELLVFFLSFTLRIDIGSKNFCPHILSTYKVLSLPLAKKYLTPLKIQTIVPLYFTLRDFIERYHLRLLKSLYLTTGTQRMS